MNRQTIQADHPASMPFSTTPGRAWGTSRAFISYSSAGGPVFLTHLAASPPQPFGRSPPMRFRPGARLDPSQVEDVRGRSGGFIPGGGVAVGGGGLGVVGLIIYIAIQLLSGGANGPLSNLDGSTVATQSPSQALGSECRTGKDANTNDDCRIVGYINSIQTYWS